MQAKVHARHRYKGIESFYIGIEIYVATHFEKITHFEKNFQSALNLGPA